jgi:hypothetical protein
MHPSTRSSEISSTSAGVMKKTQIGIKRPNYSQTSKEYKFKFYYLYNSVLASIIIAEIRCFEKPISTVSSREQLS